MSLFSNNNQAVSSGVQPGANTDQLGDNGPVLSGLSGNELYCISLLGFKPGNILLGNCVYAIGFIGSMGSNIRTAIGGEVSQITNMIAEGRRLSLERFNNELNTSNYIAATGLTSELVFHEGNIEFLTIGSAITPIDATAQVNKFTSSSDGQELYCQYDSNYFPLGFVFGNVAYSIGLGRGLIGNLKELKKGEITQFSDIFNVTRNLALERVKAEARKVNANSVVGIRTTILPVGVSSVQEMIMIGTASYNPALAETANLVGGVITSDLTAEETWNVTRMGYAPMELVLGTSVYSLGMVGGIKATLSNFVKGEISVLTEMIYGAREESLKKVKQQALNIGADDVLGIKTYIYQLGNGVIEFLAIGTAVKKIDGLKTNHDQLPPQAIIRDKDTFINTADLSFGNDLQNPNV